MKIRSARFEIDDWSKNPVVEYPGKRGLARGRTINLGRIRIRVVEYSPGYLAGHWCERGHILYVTDGELETELKDGRRFLMRAGMGYHVSNSRDNPHRSSTKGGAKLFIVD